MSSTNILDGMINYEKNHCWNVRCTLTNLGEEHYQTQENVSCFKTNLLIENLSAAPNQLKKITLKIKIEGPNKTLTNRR